MRVLIFLLVFSLGIFFSCQNQEPEQEDGVGLSLFNSLDQIIDTLAITVNTSSGTDSILFTQVEPGEQSNVQYFEESKYYYIETDDIFIVSKGYFIIDAIRYDLSNCFCDPNLNEGFLSDGEYIINVIEIDALRGNVEYLIEKK